ncbi:MAG: hypothetical protein AAGM22_14450 [Acidobacteriota bacterium]
MAESLRNKKFQAMSHDEAGKILGGAALGKTYERVDTNNHDGTCDDDYIHNDDISFN